MKNRIAMMIAAVAAMFAASSASGANAYWYGEGGTGVGAKGANAWSTTALDTSVEGWADALATWAGSGAMYVPLADNTINLAGGLTVTTVLNPDTAAKSVLFTNGTLTVSQNNGWPGSGQQLDSMTVTFGRGAACYLSGSNPRMQIEKGTHLIFTDGATYSEKNGKNDSYYNLIGANGNASNSLVVANGATVTLKSQLRIGAYSGYASTGMVHVAGGTLNANNNTHMGVHWSKIANEASSVGYLIVDGGNVPGGTGKFKTGTFGFGRDSTAAGTSHAEIHVNEGGVLEVTALNCYGSGTRKFYANGGTVRASANTTTLFNTVSAGYNPTVAEIEAGGLTIDSQNFTVSAAIWPFTGEGAITKVGSGSLTLTSPTTQQGGYIAKEGTLSFSGTAVTVPVVATNGAVVAVTNNATVAGQIVAENDGTVRLENGSTVSGQVVAENGGTVRFENGSTVSGQVVAENGGTVRFENGTTVSGTVNLRGGAAVEIPNTVATTAEFVFSRNSILSLVTDTSSVPHLTIGSTPLYNPITVKLSGKTPIVKNAPILSVTEGTLVNRASQLPAITIDVSSLSDAVALGAEFSVTLSADLKSLLLSVTLANPGNTFSWTGAGDGVKFSDDANWGGGAAPAPGAAVALSFPTPSGTITNDIAGLTPVSITFGRNCPDVTIAGEALTGLGAITNLSTIGNATFANSVSYPDRVMVYHGGKFNNNGNPDSWYDSDIGLVIFDGGVTGAGLWDSTAEPAPHNIYAGHFVRDNAAVFNSTLGGNYRNMIYRDSSLSVKYANNLYELGIDKGAKFIAQAVTNTAYNTSNTEGRNRVAGLVSAGAEFIVNGELVYTGSTDRHTCFGSYSTSPVFKIEKLIQRMTGSWAHLANFTDVTTYETYYIGKGGISQIGQTANQTAYICLGDNSGRAKKHITLAPWYSDFTIGRHPGNNAAISIRGTVTFCTDDESGTGRTITMDGNIFHVVTHGFTISGSGKFRFNGDNVSHGSNAFTSEANPVLISGTATFEMGPAARFSLGALTVNNGATYSLADASATTVTNGAMTLATGSTLKISSFTGAKPAIYASGAMTLNAGANIVVDGATLADGDYTLVEATSAISSANFTSVNISGTALGGKRAALRLSSDRMKLVLSVGDAYAPCIWTGEAGDCKFSTAANWQGGAVPAPGSTREIMFATGSETVTNDIGVLSPAKITFSAGVSAGLAIAGEYGFTGVSAVINASSAHPDIAVPVECSSTINSVQTGGYTVFSGGITGTTPENHTVYYGNYTLTDAEWTPAASSQIPNGSTVNAKTVVNPNNLTVAAGGKLSALAISSANSRAFAANNGEIEVSGIIELLHNDSYFYNSNCSGLIRAGGFKINNSTAVNGYTRMHAAPDATGTMNIEITGSNGFSFDSGTLYTNRFHNTWSSKKKYSTAVYAGNDFVLSARPEGADVKSWTMDANAVLYFYTNPYDDYKGSRANPKTVTVKGSIMSNGSIQALGNGTLVFDGPSSKAAQGFSAKDSVTIVLASGTAKKMDAAVSMGGSSRLFLPEAGTATTEITGALTLNSGTSLVVTNLSVGVTALSVASLEADSVILLVEGDAPLADGAYTILTATGGDLAAETAAAFTLAGSAIANRNASLSVSGANLVLTVDGEGTPVPGFHLWTGGGENANFSTAANWLSGSAPVAGDGKGIKFPTGSGRIVNDIPGLNPAWINFSGDAGGITFAGEPFTGVGYIRSASSTANNKFEMAVYFADTIRVSQTVAGVEAAENKVVDYDGKVLVDFAGGAYGVSNGVVSTWSRIITGQHRYSSDTGFTATENKLGTRFVIATNSSIGVETITGRSINELAIDYGGALTAGTYRAQARLLQVNYGELVVTNELIAALPANDIFSHWKWSEGGKFKFEKITIDDSACTAAKWFRFSESDGTAGNDRSQRIYIGAGGINFAAGRKYALTSICFGGKNSNYHTYVYPWHSDYTIAKSDLESATRDIAFSTAPVHMMTEEEDGTPHTITLNGIAGDGGAVYIEGAGAFVVNSDCTRTGATIVTNGATLAFGPGANFGTGAMDFSVGTTLKFTDGLSTGTKGGALSFSGEGTVALVIDGETLAAGDYTVYASSAALPGDTTARFALSGTAIPDPASLPCTLHVAEDGKTLKLLVGAYAGAECVWTGNGANANFSNAANWLGGAVPSTGGETVLIPAAAGELVNDLPAFAPVSITFGEGIGAGLVLSGNNITVSGAITNLSTAVSPVINARVDFTGNIMVNQKATGHDNRTNSHIVFEGSVHAAADCGNTDPAAGSAAIYGHYFADYTPAAGFSPTATGSNRYTVLPDSSLTVENVATLREICVAQGGAVTAGVVRLSNGGKGNDRLSWANYGEVVITDELILSASGDKQAVYTEDSNMNGVFKINKVTQNMTGSWMYFGCFQGSTHKATRLTFYFGEEGLTFGESGLASIYSAGADNANSWVTFRPWHTSFKLDRGTGRTAGSELIIHRNATFCTDNEDDEPGRIIVNGRIRAKSSPAITISGSGVFELNESATNDSQPPVTLTDTATLKFGAANVTLTAGAVTLGGGTTLSLPLVANGSAPVALGGTLAFAGEGKVKIVLGDGSKIDEGDWPVFTLSNLMPDGATEMFELQNDAAATAKFYSSDGKTLRLVVGESEYSGPSVWTGAAGDGKMNTAGNWLLDKIPNVPGATVYFPSASGEIENDIQGFAPASITFGNGIGNMTIAGNAISGLYAVTNLSTTANVTFTVPVEYAAGQKIVTYHAATYNNTTGTMPVTTGMVIFNGGVTGEEEMFNTTGSRNIYAGHYNRTTDAVFTATTYKNGSDTGIRKVIFDNSSLTAKTAGSTDELYIGDGSAFTAAVQTISGRICTANRGEYVVTGVLTNNTADMVGIYVDANYTKLNDGAVFKIRNLVSNGYFCFGGNNSNNAYSLTNDWYIGEGGLYMAGSKKYFYTRNTGDLTRIHPWKSDFAINGINANSSTDYDIYLASTGLSGGSIAFITDDEDGVPRTITMNAKFGCRAAVSNACSLTVGGSGTLRWNSTGSDFYGPTRVTDTATFAFAPGAKLGAGPITVERGAALGVSGAGSVNFDNDVDFAYGSRLAFNFTSLGTAPCMAFANEPDLSNKSIFLSVTADEGVVPRSMTGKWCIATGLAAGTTRDDFIIAEVPTWVDSASPISIEGGNLYLNVKQPGFSLSIR